MSARGARFPLLFLCLASACLIEEQRYVVENLAVALTVDTPPALVSEDDDEIFIVTRDFELPVTPPKSADLNRLTEDAAGKNLPFPRLPWVENGDIELQLEYTLANQGDSDVLATVILNGRNEFFVYTPAALDFNQWERRFALKGKERVHGVVTELEMDEIAVDLATVVNGAPVSNLVVHSLSQSGRDERVTPYIPSVIPGLVGLTAGILTTSAANVVLEVTIRAQDHGDRLAKRSEKRWELPEPTPFVPVVVDEDEQ